MYSINVRARAKINPALCVVGKREDGYHDLKMIMQTVNLCDNIIIEKTRDTNISLTTNLSWLPCDDRNLVYKAAALIKERYDIKQGVKIELIKKIPSAAGLAGGSADCAATLVGMNRLFEIGIPTNELMKLGKELGADVPYCLLRGTALAEGIGEVLTQLPPFPNMYVLLAKPAINISTPMVFKEFSMDNVTAHPDVDGMIECIKNKDTDGICKRLANDLETVTIKNYPIIGKIKEEMMRCGARGSLMSGSGSTVFGLFDTYEQGIKALKNIRAECRIKDVFLTTVFNTARQ